MIDFDTLARQVRSNFRKHQEKIWPLKADDPQQVDNAGLSVSPKLDFVMAETRNLGKDADHSKVATGTPFDSYRIFRASSAAKPPTLSQSS